MDLKESPVAHKMGWIITAIVAAAVFMLARWYYKPPDETVSSPGLTDGQLALALHPPRWVADADAGLTNQQRAAVIGALLAAVSPVTSVEASALEQALVKRKITIASYLSGRAALALSNSRGMNDLECMSEFFSPLIGILTMDHLTPQLLASVLTLYVGGTLSGARVMLPISFPVADRSRLQDIFTCNLCDSVIEGYYAKCTNNHIRCRSCFLSGQCSSCDTLLNWQLSPLIVE